MTDGVAVGVAQTKVVVLSRPPAIARVLGVMGGVAVHEISIEPRYLLLDILGVLSKEILDAKTILYLPSDLSFQDQQEDDGGLELLKHLRVSQWLGIASLVPVVIELSETAEAYIRARADNSILAGPGTWSLERPVLLASLLRLLHSCKPFADRESMRLRLRGYLSMTSDDELQSTHDYRNVSGVTHLYREFALTHLPADTQNRSEAETALRRALWVKKRAFLDEEESRAEPPPTDAVFDLQANSSGHRFLYVDDEHDRGWCDALFTGLFGRPPRPGELHSRITVSRELTCLGDPRETEELLQRWFEQWEAWLARWSAAEEAYRLRFNDHMKGLRSARTTTATEPHRGSVSPIESWTCAELELLRQVDREAVLALPFSLVFLDLRYKRDGVEEKSQIAGHKLLRTVKDNDPGVPVIVFTASNSVRNYSEARSLDADGFWIKAASSGSELASHISRLLKHSNLRQVWANVCKIERKVRLFGLTVAPAGPQIYEMDQYQRGLIHNLLVEAFCLLRDGLYPTWGAGDHLDTTRIVLNLALVQEVRFRGFRDEQWAEVSSVFEKEGTLRSTRNRALHVYRRRRPEQRLDSRVPLQEVLGLLDYTLQWFLDDGATRFLTAYRQRARRTER